jgi:hypothetical protein
MCCTLQIHDIYSRSPDIHRTIPGLPTCSPVFPPAIRLSAPSVDEPPHAIDSISIAALVGWWLGQNGRDGGILEYGICEEGQPVSPLLYSTMSHSDAFTSSAPTPLPRYRIYTIALATHSESRRILARFRACDVRTQHAHPTLTHPHSLHFETSRKAHFAARDHASCPVIPDPPAPTMNDTYICQLAGSCSVIHSRVPGLPRCPFSLSQAPKHRIIINNSYEPFLRYSLYSATIFNFIIF